MLAESLEGRPPRLAPARELVVLTNVPTPYRISFFNSLNSALAAHGAGLRVLYCALREPHRDWTISLEDQTYAWTVLPGWHPKLRRWYPHINPSVVRHLRRARPTWILSAGAWNLPTVLLAAQRFLAGAAYRIFWSEGHARAVLHPHGLIAAARRRALRAYDAFAVPNEASARFIRAEAGDDVRVMLLPNTIDDEFFRVPSGTDRGEARRRLGIAETVAVIVCMAQLEDRKGVLELASGYEQLAHDMRSGTLLVFAGAGSLRAELEARARALVHGGIRVVGYLERPALREWLWAADVFALATKRDPNPLSVIEAAFAGLPLVVSRQAGNVDELVQDGANGFVLERPDAEHVTSSLQRFLALDRDARQAMGKRSLAIATRGFRRRDVACRFVEELMAPDHIGRERDTQHLTKGRGR